jgi:hypothetical protein
LVLKQNYVAEKEQEMKEFKEKQDNYLKTLLSEVKGEDYCQVRHLRDELKLVFVS